MFYWYNKAFRTDSKSRFPKCGPISYGVSQHIRFSGEKQPKTSTIFFVQMGKVSTCTLVVFLMKRNWTGVWKRIFAPRGTVALSDKSCRYGILYLPFSAITNDIDFELGSDIESTITWSAF